MHLKDALLKRSLLKVCLSLSHLHLDHQQDHLQDMLGYAYTFSTSLLCFTHSFQLPSRQDLAINNKAEKKDEEPSKFVTPNSNKILSALSNDDAPPVLSRKPGKDQVNELQSPFITFHKRRNATIRDVPVDVLQKAIQEQEQIKAQ